MTENTNPNNKEKEGQTIIINNVSGGNSMGTAGFVLALLGLFLGWIPFFGFIIWFLGLILSFLGMSQPPRGLAITGFIISLIWLILFSIMGGLIFLG